MTRQSGAGVLAKLGMQGLRASADGCPISHRSLCTAGELALTLALVLFISSSRLTVSLARNSVPREVVILTLYGRVSQKGAPVHQQGTHTPEWHPLHIHMLEPTLVSEAWPWVEADMCMGCLMPRLVTGTLPCSDGIGMLADDDLMA